MLISINQAMPRSIGSSFATYETGRDLRRFTHPILLSHLRIARRGAERFQRFGEAM